MHVGVSTLVFFLCMTTVSGWLSGTKREQKREELSDECQKLIQSPEIDDDKMTREELVCVFWQLEGSKAKAEEKADQAIKDGDDNGNGVIDNGEKF